MTPEHFFGTVLAALIVGVAVLVIFARDLLTAILSFFALGIWVAMAWMVLAAPDVALTEVALGSGVTGALLLGARARLRARPEPQAPASSIAPQLSHTVPAALCAGLTAGIIAVVLILPTPSPSLAPAVNASLAPTGLGNAVTGVLMVFRALDTLLEKLVLLLAVVGVWSLADPHLRNGRPPYRLPPEPASQLVFLARALIPTGLVAAVYLFWVAADQPGSAFAGGAVLSAMVLLAFLCGAIQPPRIGSKPLRLALVAGVLTFLAVGFAGILTGSGFLSYPPGQIKALIVLIEVAMVISIGATLLLLVVGPPTDDRA